LSDGVISGVYQGANNYLSASPEEDSWWWGGNRLCSGFREDPALGFYPFEHRGRHLPGGLVLSHGDPDVVVNANGHVFAYESGG
jgi:hypothetical protein